MVTKALYIGLHSCSESEQPLSEDVTAWNVPCDRNNHEEQTNKQTQNPKKQNVEIGSHVES